VEAIDGIIDPADLAGLKVDVVACSADAATLRAIRRVLSERDGPIVRLVAAVINPTAYVHERAVCVDTTAAGGNASLLAASE
jgi:RHH-type transcriptional regulator, proline utilization regulon repressor / proline dehydrogenase / delta 1-pyrroline-5-carboxylate dehydrogenase